MKQTDTIVTLVTNIFKKKQYPQAWDKLKASDERIIQMVGLCCRRLQAFHYIKEVQYPSFLSGMYFQTKTSNEPLFFGDSTLRLCLMSGVLKNFQVYTLDKMNQKCGPLVKPHSAVFKSWRAGSSEPNESELPLQKLKAEGVELIEVKDDLLPWRFVKKVKRKDYKTGEVKVTTDKKTAWYTDPHARLLRAVEVRHLKKYFPDCLHGAVRETSEDIEMPEESKEEASQSWAERNTQGFEVENEEVEAAIERKKEVEKPPVHVSSMNNEPPPWPDEHTKKGVDLNNALEELY